MAPAPATYRNNPTWARLAAFASAAALLYMFWAIMTSPDAKYATELNNWPGGPWHDPTNDFIDEPPGLLRRVNGDNYAADNPQSDRANASIISLVRNSELDQMLSSMRDLERTWNSKFNYPWMFFNDEPFTPQFKKATQEATNAKVSFHQIPKEHWETPPWINQDLYEESVKILEENDVQYAGKLSYHQMCRWNSGFFAHHPALKNVKWYWRVEPKVHFFCDVDYDVFRYMEDHNKTYGFTINLYDSPESIPTLWKETEKFLAAPENQAFVQTDNAVDWLTDKKHRPDHHQKAGFSTCHFWSNFEIADLDFWRSYIYTKYFEHLDRAGGFFYERWGDAPVHSIALAHFKKKEELHWFRDIGYQHIPYFNCPNRPPGKCKGCRTGRFTDGERYLYHEDCRPNWFEKAGFGEWEKVGAS